MQQREIGHFRKLVVLARGQLASIERRLSGSGGGRWSEYLFRSRHVRIKRILGAILHRREAAVGEGAVMELIEDLKSMGASDDGEWSDVTKEESDYLRFVLHGIRASVSEEKGRVPENEASE